MYEKLPQKLSFYYFDHIRSTKMSKCDKIVQIVKSVCSDVWCGVSEVWNAHANERFCTFVTENNFIFDIGILLWAMVCHLWHAAYVHSKLEHAIVCWMRELTTNTRRAQFALCKCLHLQVTHKMETIHIKMWAIYGFLFAIGTCHVLRALHSEEFLRWNQIANALIEHAAEMMQNKIE